MSTTADLKTGDRVHVDGQKSMWGGVWRVKRVNKTTARIVSEITGDEERAPIWTLSKVEEPAQ